MFNWKVLSLCSACVVGGLGWYVHSITAPQELPKRRAVVRDRSIDPASVSPDADAGEEAEAPADPIDVYMAELDQAEEYLGSIDGYTATFMRQIRKNGKLRDLEEIAVKIRHEPFSVYMKWQSDGQEVLYVEGENDDKLLARPGKGFFRRTLKLAPTSKVAMMDSRYPVTELGVLGLVKNAQIAMAACPALEDVRCEVESAELDGTPIRRYTVVFDSPELEPTYSKCEVCFSEENPMPICITSNGWTEEGTPGGLIEHYYYKDLAVDPGFTDADFNSENETYAFRR